MTIEESLAFTLRYLKSQADLSSVGKGRGDIVWTSKWHGRVGSAAVEIDTTDLDEPYAKLAYFVNGKPHATVIQLVTTPCNYGGVRHWLECPNCQRRVTAVYLPARRTRFLCRHCHNLTYASAQTAHENDRGSMAGLKMALDAHTKYLDAAHEAMTAREGSKRKARALRKMARYGQSIRVGAGLSGLLKGRL